ncbi:MAG TPA: AMP-binding protein [Acidimicrobiales bacterium]|nr:AMP-binding protein [Acidimicrobiales bacterium]
MNDRIWGILLLDFASAWEEVADTVAERDAVVQGERRLSYRAFDDAAARFATAIDVAGLPEGGKIALYLHNCPEYLIAQFGAFKHRAVPVNVNYRYLDDELVYLLENSDAGVLVFHSSLSACVGRVRARLTNVRLFVEVDDGGVHLEETRRFTDLLEANQPQARKQRSPEDLYLLYTGGTTGMPKGVMFPQGEFVGGLFAGALALGLITSTPIDRAGIRALVDEITVSGPEVSISCCPLMHGTGMWIGAMPALLTGGVVVLLESRSFDAEEVWRLTEQEGATRIVIVGDPFARPLLRALEARESEGRAVDTASVRHVISSGAVWSREIKDGLRSRMTALLVDSLGSTEGLGFGVSSASRDQGAPTAHFSLTPDSKVISEKGLEVSRGTGEQGILASRTAAYAYYKDDEKSARTFMRIDGKGYVLTGDWATVDGDGTITLLGRGSMTINTGGEKVFAEEVEEAIKRHHLVEDCLVVGLPDERFGQRVVAVIGSPAPLAPTSDEIRDFLRSSLAPYKIPRAVVVRATIQRAPNGKADYKWALQTALESHSTE